MEKSFYAFGTMNTIRIDDELADNNAYTGSKKPPIKNMPMLKPV